MRATARAAGMMVVAQPVEYTVPALIAAIRDYLVSDDKQARIPSGGSKM
jgi:hypothetical protein